VSAEDRLHCTPGAVRPIRGSPPACCGRLLKRFVSAPRGRINARFNDRASYPPDVGALGHRTTRTCAWYRHARDPRLSTSLSSGCGHAARRKGVERDLRMHHPHPRARRRRPQQVPEPTQNVKRCADHRPCQPAELCATAHRGRAVPEVGATTYLARRSYSSSRRRARSRVSSTLRTGTPSVNHRHRIRPTSASRARTTSLWIGRRRTISGVTSWGARADRKR
jgi:hypothetical protein